MFANPVSPSDVWGMAGMCYIGIGHRALLPVGCVGKCRGRKV